VQQTNTPDCGQSAPEQKAAITLQSRDRSCFPEDYHTLALEQWKCCVEMANGYSEKRSNMNALYITINSALLAVAPFALDAKNILLAIAGIAVCILWLSSLTTYKILSSVKYEIIHQMEKELPYAPFTYERSRARSRKNYTSLTKLEMVLPAVFLLLYLLILVLSLLQLA